MSALAYYDEEKVRWPQLAGYPPCGRNSGGLVGRPGWLTREEAEVAVPKLARHFGIKVDGGLCFTSGRNHSTAYYRAITLNVTWLSWLLVAHELAHCLHRQQYREAGSGERFHGRRHARLTDRLCRYIVKQGWHEGALAHALALKAERAELRVKAAACPPPIEARIVHRQDQVARLTRKIKALSTRRTNALRSLRGLERQRAKMEA